MHEHSHITRAVAAMDSCFALIGAHQHGIAVRCITPFLIIIFSLGYNFESNCVRFEPRRHFKSRLSLKMTTAQVVETSVTVNNNSPIQDYVHPDDKLNLLLKC